MFNSFVHYVSWKYTIGQEKMLVYFLANQLGYRKRKSYFFSLKTNEIINPEVVQSICGPVKKCYAHMHISPLMKLLIFFLLISLFLSLSPSWVWLNYSNFETAQMCHVPTEFRPKKLWLKCSLCEHSILVIRVGFPFRVHWTPINQCTFKAIELW